MTFLRGRNQRLFSKEQKRKVRKRTEFKWSNIRKSRIHRQQIDQRLGVIVGIEWRLYHRCIRALHTIWFRIACDDSLQLCPDFCNIAADTFFHLRHKRLPYNPPSCHMHRLGNHHWLNSPVFFWSCDSIGMNYIKLIRCSDWMSNSGLQMQ